jgi:hypothetical protein
MRRLFVSAAFLALAAAAPAQAATLRMFSYDAADAQTRRVAGSLTFEFRQHLITTEVVRIDATTGDASAPLREASDRDLGVSLSSLIGETARERDVYEVLREEEGGDMIRAFCPGAERAWIAIGRLRANLPLRVHVLGAPQTGAARVCATLNFDFRGEWRGLRPRDRVRQNEIRVPHFPY